MKNSSVSGLVMLLTLLVLLGWNEEGYPQNPLPDIKSNHSDGPVLLSRSDTLTISAALSSGNKTDSADWWLLAATPYGIFCLSPNGWTNSVSPAYQGPLFDLPSFDLSSMSLSDYPAGNYDLYLAVDTVMDGMLTLNALFWDVVRVTVLEGGLNVPLAQVPIEFRRRAAQLVSEMSDERMTPEWEAARLGEVVHPFYRPDVEGIAYLEFEVLPTGFMMLSTGEHDFPVSHWSPGRPSVSQELGEKALEAGKDIARLFKLDTLSYAAEDGLGEMVATVGDEPPRVSGMDPAWLGLGSASVTEVVARPLQVTASDQEAAGIPYEVQVTGPEPAAIELSEWGSWQALKAEYRGTYAVLIDGLKHEAREEWEAERVARVVGEGLLIGETFRLALLYDGSEFSASGEGAAHAAIRKTGDGTRLEIIAQSAPPEGMAAFSLSVTYPNHEMEHFKFVIIDPEVIRTAGTLGTSADPQGRAGEGTKTSKASSWSPWTMVWAGSEGDQRLYHQFDDFTAVGTCPSGCGATAWAMLFGWADHQAWIGNTYWAPRNGLYLKDGGKNPAPDADAPRNQTTGIENITKEIKGYIGSICWAGWGGPATFTLPWEMDEAYKYFSGRTGTTLKADYSSVGIAWDSIRVKARDSIWDRETPAVIGTGWLSHYPLAYGYAWRSRTVCKAYLLFGYCLWETTDYSRWFYVNQGWKTGRYDWVPASTWFSGEIFP